MKDPKFLWLRKNSLRYKLLTIPIYRTFDRDKAEKSRLDYRDAGFGKYQLRILGVLHGLFGLTVITYEGDKNEAQRR